MTNKYTNLQTVIYNCKLTVENELEAWKIVYSLIDNAPIKYNQYVSHFNKIS